MVDVSYTLVLLLATFIKFAQGLPIFHETNYEPFPNYLNSLDFDQPKLSMYEPLPLPILDVMVKKNIAIGRADGFRPGK